MADAPAILTVTYGSDELLYRRKVFGMNKVDVGTHGCRNKCLQGFKTKTPWEQKLPSMCDTRKLKGDLGLHLTTV